MVPFISHFVNLIVGHPYPHPKTYLCRAINFSAGVTSKCDLHITAGNTTVVSDRLNCQKQKFRGSDWIPHFSKLCYTKPTGETCGTHMAEFGCWISCVLFLVKIPLLCICNLDSSSSTKCHETKPTNSLLSHVQPTNYTGEPVTLTSNIIHLFIKQVISFITVKIIVFIVPD